MVLDFQGLCLRVGCSTLAFLGVVFVAWPTEKTTAGSPVCGEGSGLLGRNLNGEL